MLPIGIFLKVGLNGVGTDCLVATEPYQGVHVMNTTSYEQGVEKGRRDALREQLNVDRLRTLQVELLTAKSLRELGLDD